jgi:hypothetical protein
MQLVSTFPTAGQRLVWSACANAATAAQGPDAEQEEPRAERQRDMPLRVLIARTRHDGCRGRQGREELLTCVEGASSGAVLRIG